MSNGRLFAIRGGGEGGDGKRITLQLMAASGRGELPLGHPYYVGSGFGVQFALLQLPEAPTASTEKAPAGPASDFASPSAPGGATVLQRRCPVTGTLQGQCEVTGGSSAAAGIFGPSQAEEAGPAMLATPTGWTIKASADGRFAYLSPPGPAGAY